MALVFAGPLRSGGLLLLLPTGVAPVEHDVDASYEPLHRGGVDLDTGLYIRNDEDLIVRGTPPLVLRRTYLSGYRTSREFGIGTTHNGALRLEGDPNRFQWAVLVLPDGVRVMFERISSGSSYHTAVYEHRSSPSAWQGARLAWIGTGWALRRLDGHLMVFQGCGHGPFKVCWILRERDADGHTTDYRRDQSGRLLRIESEDNRWIAFDYDGLDRVARAFDHAGQEVRYEYDSGGRLAHVTSSGGAEHHYTYTGRDEMATIADPGIRLENTYDADGRTVRQVNRFPHDPEPFVFSFTYEVKDGAVVQSDMSRSDGTWTRRVYGPKGYPISEAWGGTGLQTASFTYARDPESNITTALTLTCPDRSGTPLRHSSHVRPGYEEWIKWDMLRTNCSWSSERWRSVH